MKTRVRSVLRKSKLVEFEHKEKVFCSMSFQDVRRRQHPIFDNHRRIGNTANTSSTTTGTGTMQRIEGDDQQLESSRRPTLITTRSSSSSNKNNNNNNHHHHHHHRHKSRSSPSPQQQIKPQRGVRPRLSTTCPVTAKNLMDDQASSGTQETAPSVDTLSSQDEAEIPSLLSPQRDMTASRSLSIFAHLTTSIVNFQVRIYESFISYPIASLSHGTNTRHCHSFI